MQKILITGGVAFSLLSSSFAQRTEPIPAPAEVILQFGTEGDMNRFHLGELIPVQYSYSSRIPGIYFWVPENRKLAGWRSLEISCSPAVERVNRYPTSPDVMTFGQMLNAPCGGMGSAGGAGCGDCGGERPLTSTALTFGGVPLNRYVRFRAPDTYTCEASSAEIATALSNEEIRPALLVKSNPISLTIINDPSWAHSAAGSYGAAYDKLCRGDPLSDGRMLQCFDIAARITFLDTVDSLAIETAAFDGRNHGWGTGFWEAIQHSSQPKDALRLMTSRVQEPDFEVHPDVIEWLAASQLRTEAPDAFQTVALATYHAQAVETLRKYVQLLGSSLSKKNSETLAESAKTYRLFAERTYCEQQSLISTEEQNQVLALVGMRP